MSFDDEPRTPGARDEHRHGVASGSDGPSPKLLLFVVLFVVIAVFIIANDRPVEISFAVVTWETTVRWAIFIAVLLGIALDRVLIFGMRRRGDSRRRAKELKDERD
jgi:uncharacterized integral membrane protein